MCPGTVFDTEIKKMIKLSSGWCKCKLHNTCNFLKIYFSVTVDIQYYISLGVQNSG